MFIPIRKRIGLTELLIAGTVGVFAQMYVWSPTIKAQLQKEKLAKLEKDKQLQQSTETNPKT